ncbi:hypothetical protein BX600DRAFT_540356 [Xylariales sp. PMI_506]|nr:hypothetical protein BX600DRAFT_540356 [Xylariales sp. PMI_506]
MKLSVTLLHLSGLIPAAFANWKSKRDDSECCTFTFSSSGAFTCPAGQLVDGQIRLNGSYPTSTFSIDKDGGITDENGFGCIITDPPTTQFQCDQGKEPVTGFSISSDNQFLYKGSPSFFACPATDIEWNIYVTPDFGQSKCVAITLQTDGCGSQASSCSAGPPSTVYQTQWMTQWSTLTNNETVTVTETKLEITTLPCTSSRNATTRGCSKCTRKNSSTSGWNMTTASLNSTTSGCHNCDGYKTSVWSTNAGESSEVGYASATP